jgi:hypothetical protein
MFPINEKFTALDVAFPANVLRFMPKYEDVRGSDAEKMYEGIVSTLFFRGGKLKLKPRKGVDEAKAMRHIKCVLGSFEPSHEHKTAAVAWLFDQWFESVELAK